MPDLDELEAKARAAKEARERLDRARDGEPSSEEINAENDWADAFDEFRMAVRDPDTVLHLIERVRAGEELYKVIAEGHRGSAYSQCRLCRWARRWESLAHSPQETV